MLEDEFGDVIAKALGGLGLSAEELAGRSGVEAQAIAAFEGYRQDPSREQSDALARVLGLDPNKLWDSARAAWGPRPVDPLLGGRYPVEKVWYERYRVWTYLIGDAGSGLCAVVDPGGDAAETLAAVKRRGWKIGAILATHTHGDHVGVLAGVVGDSDVPVYVGSAESSALQGKAKRLIPVGDAEALTVGALRFETRHTPGHTAGSTCYLVEDGIFVGDAMFSGSLGRTILGPAAYAGHKGSVRQKVLGLPPDTKIFPGHGPQSTVAEELAHNPFF